MKHVIYLFILIFKLSIVIISRVHWYLECNKENPNLAHETASSLLNEYTTNVCDTFNSNYNIVCLILKKLKFFLHHFGSHLFVPIFENIFSDCVANDGEILISILFIQFKFKWTVENSTNINYKTSKSGENIAGPSSDLCESM